MAVTSHDVARYAGVSQATVSRALRGAPGISAKTVERVQRAARELAYVPNDAARSLSTSKSRTIGVVAAELTNPFYPELIQPIRNELDRKGYRTLLIPDSSESPAAVDRLVDGTLDGVLITTALASSHLPLDLAARKVPFALLNRDVTGIVADSCTIDNRSGGGLVAELLADLGHHRIAAIFGPEETSTSRDRERGFRDGLNDKGIPLRSGLVRHGAFSYATGYSASLDLLAQAEPPTAVFCGNDVIAFGACNAVAALGLKSGNDITIIGFDDISMAAWELLNLTTIHCDLTAMAQHAVRLLTQRIADPDRATERVVLDPTIVLRGSHHRVSGVSA